MRGGRGLEGEGWMVEGGWWREDGGGRLVEAGWWREAGGGRLVEGGWWREAGWALAGLPPGWPALQELDDQTCLQRGQLGPVVLLQDAAQTAPQLTQAGQGTAVLHVQQSVEQLVPQVAVGIPTGDGHIVRCLRLRIPNQKWLGLEIKFPLSVTVITFWRRR